MSIHCDRRLSSLLLSVLCDCLLLIPLSITVLMSGWTLLRHFGLVPVQMDCDNVSVCNCLLLCPSVRASTLCNKLLLLGVLSALMKTANISLACFLYRVFRQRSCWHLSVALRTARSAFNSSITVDRLLTKSGTDVMPLEVSPKSYLIYFKKIPAWRWENYNAETDDVICKTDDVMTSLVMASLPVHI